MRLLLLIALVLQSQTAPVAQRTDGLGDPLPRRAVARLGSSRLRHGGRVDRLLFSPDGKKLASWGGEYRVPDGVVHWDAATGKELRRHALPGAWLDAWSWPRDGRLPAVLASPEDKHFLVDLDAGNTELQPLPERDGGQDVRFAIAPAANLLAVSKDGRDGRGYTVELRELRWDRPARELKVLRFCQSNLEYATILMFTPDGRTLIAFTPPRYEPPAAPWRAVLWDVETAAERGMLSLPDRAMATIGQTVDVTNEWLALGLADGSISPFNLKTGKREVFPQRHKAADPGDPPGAGGVVALRFRRDGKTLVTAGSDHLMRVWDVTSRSKRAEFEWRGGLLYSMAISPDGSAAALGGRDGVIRLVNTANGAEVCPQPGHTSWIHDVAVARDGRIAATAASDQTIRIWDMENGRDSRLISCDGRPRDCSLTPDGKTLLALVNRAEDPDEAALRVWNVATGVEAHATGLTGTRAQSLRLAPDGRSVVTLSSEQVSTWSWPEGKRLRAMTVPRGEVRGFRPLGSILAVAADGSQCVSAVRYVNLWRGQVIDAAGGSLDLWDLTGGKSAKNLSASDGMSDRAAFTSADELIVTSDLPFSGPDDQPRFPHGVLHVIEAATGRLKRVHALPAVATALAVAPDGRTAFLGTGEGTIHVCELATGGIRFQVAGHHDQVTDLALAARGRRLVSTSRDASALVWDVSLSPTVPAEALEQAWEDLAGADAAKAYKALTGLAATPERSIPLLAQRLLAAPPQPGSDVPSPGRRREIRSIELLEDLATAPARGLLARLADGDPTALRTQEAAASLRRLRAR
jgi:WD40 repeat protein